MKSRFQTDFGCNHFGGRLGGFQKWLPLACDLSQLVAKSAPGWKWKPLIAGKIFSQPGKISYRFKNLIPGCLMENKQLVKSAWVTLDNPCWYLFAKLSNKWELRSSAGTVAAKAATGWFAKICNRFFHDSPKLIHQRIGSKNSAIFVEVVGNHWQSIRQKLAYSIS